MARLMKCRDCGSAVSKRAKVCLGCGAPVKRPFGIVGWAILGVSLLFFRGLLRSDPRPSGPPGVVADAPRPAARPAPSRAAVALLPEVAAFFAAHPEFGAPGRAEAMPDWADGRRQRVATAAGRDLLFYEKAGAVVTVYEDEPGKGRVAVWGD